MDSPKKRHANAEAAIDRLLAGAPTVERKTQLARTNSHGLTDKQEMFAQGVLKYPSIAEAYRQSYDAENMSVNSIYSEASKLMDHPAVAARVKGLMTAREDKRNGMDAMRIRRHVFDRLMVESVDDESPPAARIKALELLGKIDVVSMFKESKHGDAVEPDDIEGLQDKLKTLLTKMIDITPNSVGDV